MNLEAETGPQAPELEALRTQLGKCNLLFTSIAWNCRVAREALRDGDDELVDGILDWIRFKANVTPQSRPDASAVARDDRP